MATLISTGRHRIASTQELAKVRRHRVSNSDIVSVRRHRVASVQQLVQIRKHRIFAAPAEVQPSGYSSPVPQYDLAWKLGEGTLGVDLKVKRTGETDLDLTGVPGSLQITHNESAASSWSMPITDPTGFYHPKKAGTWNKVLDDKAYGASDAIVKTFQCNLTWGGFPYYYTGVPNLFGHARNHTTGHKFDFSWGGIDLSSKLYRKAQTAATIRSDRSKIVTNKAALAELFTAYGIRYDIQGLHEIPINVQHRQDGRPGDWMMALLEATMAEWTVRGETIVCYQPAYAGPAKWRYDSSAAILEDNLASEASRIVNFVTVRRAAEGGGNGGGNTKVECYNYGSGYSQSFNPPLNGFHYEYSGNGVASDIICRNKAGEVFAVIGPRIEGNVAYPPFLINSNGGVVNGVASISLTWGAPNASTPPEITGGSGEVEFFGNTGANVGGLVGVEHDEVYTVTADDPESILAYGLQPLELRPNPLFMRSIDAQYFADQYILRKAWDPDPISYRVNLNLALNVGDRVEIVDGILGITENRYVHQVTHSISDDPAQRFTRFSTILFGKRE